MRVINTTFFKKYLSKENKQGKRFHFPHIRKLNFGVQFICIYFLINVARTIKYTQPGVLHKKRLFCQKQQFILKFGAFDLTSPDRFQVDFKKFGNRYLKRNMAQDFFSVSQKKKKNSRIKFNPGPSTDIFQFAASFLRKCFTKKGSTRGKKSNIS